MMINKNLIVSASIVLLFSVIIIGFYFQPFGNKSSIAPLHISENAIPLIEVRTDETGGSYTYLHLCIWNPLEALWYRDEVPIVIIQGGPVKIFWNGTSRIFITPDNPRGSFKILEANALFEIHSIPFENNMNAIFVADQNNHDEKLIIRKQANSPEFRLDITQKNNKTSYVDLIYPLSKSDQMRLIPIDATWSDKGYDLFFCFQHQRPGGISHGVLQCIIDPSNDLPPKWTKLIESFFPDSSIKYAWTPSAIYRIHSNLQINSAYRKEQGFLPFNAALSNLNSFEQTLFGNNEIISELAKTGTRLKENKRTLPVIGTYLKYLLVSWSPDAEVVDSSKTFLPSGKVFQAQQITAILNNLPIGRIEHLGHQLRIYRDHTLRHEILMPENGFSYYFLLP
jgi:hypothetical protein